MASHQFEHELGSAWTDDELETMLKGLREREELDAIDAVVWLRLELAKARSDQLTGVLKNAKPPRSRD